MIKQKRIKKLPDDVIILDEPKTLNEQKGLYEPKKLMTEDLGKIFEMAICLLYDIPYDGKYTYNIEDAEKLKLRLCQLTYAFPHKLKHTAKSGSQYDFTGAEDDKIKLSAKTTKKDGKVCPQVIGQPSKKKFCEFFGIDMNFSLDQIKIYIQENVRKMLEIYLELTLDCPVIYYNEKTNKLQLIKLINKIVWSEQEIEFSHNKKNKIWNESSTISINNITIGEFQIHTHRDCIKFRWAFDNLLKQFNESFEIVNL